MTSSLSMFLRLSALLLLQCFTLAASAQKAADGYTLVWHDEFDTNGPLNPADWTYEQGFVRNEEDQWYQPENAFCKDGLLVIEARREHRPNPQYGQARGWRNREFIEYTSASVNTRDRHTWTYGRFEVSARIPAYTGCWPAIWTLGQNDRGIYGWPNNGEIDLMEYYQVSGKPCILANACWGGKRTKYNGTWSTTRTPYTHFLEKDALWGKQFHVWRMDWTEESISLYLDDELLNYVPLANTENPKTDFFPVEGYNPFRHPHYLLLNLALGGTNGGSLDDTPFPCRYEIDYVRVYQ